MCTLCVYYYDSYVQYQSSVSLNIIVLYDIVTILFLFGLLRKQVRHKSSNLQEGVDTR